MRNRERLTEKLVRAAEPRPKAWQIFDSDVLGLSICIYPSGGRSFMFDYRAAGRQRRLTIGRWPEWNVTAARERAKRKLVLMAWTETELDALRRAYASGTLRVSYDGKTLEYGSAADLLSRIRTIEGEMSAGAGRPLPVAGFAGFCRG